MEIVIIIVKNDVVLVNVVVIIDVVEVNVALCEVGIYLIVVLVMYYVG